MAEPRKKKQKSGKAEAKEEDVREQSLEDICTSEDDFAETVKAILAEKSERPDGEKPLSEEQLRGVYKKYKHPPVHRVWNPEELRNVSKMLNEIGFSVPKPVELNELLPEEARLKNGQRVPEANVFLWPDCAQELGIDNKQLEKQLDKLKLDKVQCVQKDVVCLYVCYLHSLQVLL
jgi:hypothetical protein